MVTPPTAPPAFTTIERPRFAEALGVSEGTPFRQGGAAVIVHGAQDQEAVRIEIRRKPRPQAIQTPAAAPAAGEQEKTDKPQSALRSLLKQLTEIADRIDTLNEGLAAVELNPQQAESALAELASLHEQYAAIVNGKDTARIVELAKIIQDTLQQGGKTDFLVQSLRAEEGLVGEEFLALVQHGNSFGVQSVAESLTALAGLVIEDASKDASITSQVRDNVHRALQALEGPGLEKEKPKVVPVTEEVKEVEAPELTQIDFGKTGELALSLRTFVGDDILKAAQAHYELNPQIVLSLVTDRNDEKEKERKRLLGIEESDLSLLNEGYVVPSDSLKP